MFNSRILVPILLWLFSQSMVVNANYVLNVQPIAVYDSRYNGVVDGNGDPIYSSTGTHAYTPNVNGLYVPTFASAVNDIFSQCSIAVSFKPLLTFDSATYLNVTSAEQSGLFDSDPTVSSWLASNAPANHHYVFFTNSHTNTPDWAESNPNSLPLGGSWGTRSSGGISRVSVAGVAVRPGVGATGKMRSVMSQSDDISDSASEATWENSTVPTVLAHELAHNLSLQHTLVNTDNLMYTGIPDPTGTQAVLTNSQCSDIVATGIHTANGTLTAVPEPSPILFGSLVLVMVGVARLANNAWRMHPS